MAKVGAQRAAELTGRSKSTIQRSMNNGKLSFELDPNGRRVIDVSELERVFGLSQQGGGESGNKTVEQELEKASALLEMERLKMRIKMLEDQLETANTIIDDLRGQRDQWQKQASQVLITSQYSQKQAEELREELRQREQRAREAKERREQKVQRLKPQNENAPETSGSQDEGAFKGLWKRVKNAAS